MPADIPDPTGEASAEHAYAPPKAAKRAKPKPGRHGSGQASARDQAPTVAVNPALALNGPVGPNHAPCATAAPASELQHQHEPGGGSR